MPRPYREQVTSDPALHDHQLETEIKLVGDLVLAASQSEQHLTDERIDEVLGLASLDHHDGAGAADGAGGNDGTSAGGSDGSGADGGEESDAATSDGSAGGARASAG